MSKVAKNPKELFELLGLSENDRLDVEFRSNLNDKIIDLYKNSNSTHEEIAAKTGTSRTRITALLNRSRADFSTDFMIKVLASLGYKLDLKVSKIS